MARMARLEPKIPPGLLHGYSGAPGLEPCSAVLPGPKQRAGSGVEPPGLKWSPCRMPALEP